MCKLKTRARGKRPSGQKKFSSQQNREENQRRRSPLNPGNFVKEAQNAS